MLFYHFCVAHPLEWGFTKRSQFAGYRKFSIVQRLYTALRQRTSFWSKFPGPRKTAASTTPGLRGRMSVSQGLYADRRVPGVLVETSVEPISSLQRPRTIGDWPAFGRSLVESLALAISGVPPSFAFRIRDAGYLVRQPRF